MLRSSWFPSTTSTEAVGLVERLRRTATRRVDASAARSHSTTTLQAPLQTHDLRSCYRLVPRFRFSCRVANFRHTPSPWTMCFPFHAVDVGACRPVAVRLTATFAGEVIVTWTCGDHRVSSFVLRTYEWSKSKRVAKVLVSCFAVRPFIDTQTTIPAEDADSSRLFFFGDGRSPGISSLEILVGCGPSVWGEGNGIFLVHQDIDALAGSHRDLWWRNDRSFDPPGRKRLRSPVPHRCRTPQPYGYPDGLDSPGLVCVGDGFEGRSGSVPVGCRRVVPSKSTDVQDNDRWNPTPMSSSENLRT